MKTDLLPSPLRGVIPPMVTPLLEQDQLDVEGLDRLIEHVIDGGVHGLFILGTTGEGPSLSYGLRRELVQRTCMQTAGRVPVLVGITDTSAAESLRLAGVAAEAGAQALVLAPPFYFPIEQEDLLRHVAQLASQLPLPVFLYNMPSHTKISFTAETIRRLLDLQQVIGLKDSSARALCFNQVRQIVLSQRPEFSLLIGPEELLSESIPKGAHGGVCGGANLFPRLFTELYEASVANEPLRVAELQAQVLRLPQTIYSIRSSDYAAITGIKGALAHLGICSDVVAPPLQRLSEADAAHIEIWMRELNFTADCNGKKRGSRPDRLKGAAR